MLEKFYNCDFSAYNYIVTIKKQTKIMNTYFLIQGILGLAFVSTTIILAVIAYKNRNYL